MDAAAGGVVPIPDISASSAVDADFDNFVRTETGGLLRTAYLLTGNAAGAEDVVQEALTRLYPKWPRVMAADSPNAYVRRSVVNTFLNGRRSAANREIAIDVTDYPNHRDITQAISDRDQVWRLLGRLPERQRAALVMRYFHGLSDTDAAHALGCRAGTVRSLISRGLAALRAESAIRQNGDGDA